MMKNLEKRVKREMLWHVEGQVDPLQFAYRAGEDTTLTLLDVLFHQWNFFVI